MNIEQCYQAMGSDYQNVLNRFGQSEAMVKKFARRFLQDPSFSQLKESLENEKAEEAFRAAHTLKGVCLNLGFDRLYEVSAALTESLRSREITEVCKPQFEQVEKEYEHVVACVQQIED